MTNNFKEQLDDRKYSYQLHRMRMMSIEFVCNNRNRAKGIKERFYNSSLPSLLEYLGFVKTHPEDSTEVFVRNTKDSLITISYCSVIRYHHDDALYRKNVNILVADTSIPKYLQVLYDVLGNCEPKNVVLEEFIEKYTPVYNLRKNISLIS